MVTMLTPEQGEILVALFTIGWGITVESWFVSKHTIWFNIVPLLVMMTTLELSQGSFEFLLAYLIISIAFVSLTGREGHMIKQLVGAKGYGSLMLVFGLYGGKSDSIFWSWFVVSIFVYLAWWLIRKKKTEEDFE